MLILDEGTRQHNFKHNRQLKESSIMPSTIGNVWLGIHEHMENKYKRSIYSNRTVTTSAPGQVNIL